MVRLVLHQAPLSLQLLRQALDNYRLLCRSLAADCAFRAGQQIKSAPAGSTLALERRAQAYAARAVALDQLVDQLPDPEPLLAPVGNKDDR